MSESAKDVVLYEVRDGVATLTLNRPDRMNAITPGMEKRYFELLEQASSDADVRVIVVTGAGRGFCAGADMQALSDAGQGKGSWEGSRHLQSFPTTIPKPILAAINGSCAGLGLVWALMCDLRFAAAGVKLTTAFSRRGLIAEHGSSWVLPRLIGHSRALDLMFSARIFLAEEAFELGMVNRVVPHDRLRDEVTAYAKDLAANCCPATMAAMKWQMYRHWDAEFGPALAESNELMAKSLVRDDFREGVASFLEKRPPRFEPVKAPPGSPPFTS